MDANVDDVLARRLRTQRLTSAPLPDPADAVRLLTCVQAQDAPLARFSLGMRTAGADDAVVRAAVDAGRVLRTHILRPTWHFVTPEDLRWILALTSPKVESGLAGRHRQLGLDAGHVDRALDAIAEILADRRCLTRRALGGALRDRRVSTTTEQLGHVLLLAELRGLICSGPLEGEAHTYGLVDDLVAPTSTRDRPDAVRDLVARFFTGHGPAAIRDLTRWARLTQVEIKAALADLGDRLETVSVGGTTLWFAPSADVPEQGTQRAFLLPVFDEAYLSYPQVNLPREEGHPRGSVPHRFAEAGGGVVVLDRRDVGWWKRTNRRRMVAIELVLAPSLDAQHRELVTRAARRLAAFTDRVPEIRVVT